MSNKTPSDRHAKTAWALKTSILTLILASAVVVAVPGLIWLAAQGFFFWQAEKCDPIVALTTKKVTGNGHEVTAYDTENEADRARGLGGLKCIPDNQGMLFSHDAAGVHCYWMKDMKFAIDMIWLDKDKKIIHIEQNVKPETYPKSFCPNGPAYYVLEVNTGKTYEFNWQTGMQLNF